MEIIKYPPFERLEELTRRNIPADDGCVTAAVEEVVKRVGEDGDKALVEYMERFDGVTGLAIELTPEEIEKGAGATPEKVKRAIDAAAANIEKFHRAQLPQEVRVEVVPGVVCVQRAVPVQRVGLYVPGGSAPLFSTVLMLAIPARIAGCREVVMCTPAAAGRPIAPAILYAARKCGVHRIFRIGGAQAIAAMALGTSTVPRVDKIFGPGNRYVTKAKQLVSTITSIDMPAGPSEVMVMADDTADAAFIASDLLSQAEHGPDSQAIMVTDSEKLAQNVYEEVGRQAAMLPRQNAVENSLEKSRIVIVGSRREMIDFANLYASEHLILSVSDPWEAAAGITSAGSVFIGNYSPESAGDYASGTNHTLPTNGWARSCSGVNIDSFMRKITYQHLTSDGLASLAPTIIAMAEAEGLDAHANAVKIRIEK